MHKQKIIIKGKPIDSQTRCIHYHSSLDIIAIKFKCCKEYYPCYYCHKENTDHEPITWLPGEREIKAVFCGVCKSEMTISQYINSNNHCVFCNNKLNKNCEKHHHLYFEIT